MINELYSYEDYFLKSDKDLKKDLETKLINFGYDNVVNKDGYLYAKGTTPVLLVSHMDTVHKYLPSAIFYTLDGNCAMAIEGIGGDDRCGIIMIVNMLETTDLRPSILFTEDEEIGGLGVAKFCKDYAGKDLEVYFGMEFDRRGDNDCVFYKTADEEFEKYITSFGFKTATGSYSDIDDIETEFELECVNLSSGYYNAHTESEFVCLDDMNHTLERAIDIIKQADHKFKFRPDTYSYKNWWKDYEKYSTADKSGIIDSKDKTKMWVFNEDLGDYVCVDISGGTEDYYGDYYDHMMEDDGFYANGFDDIDWGKGRSNKNYDVVTVNYDLIKFPSTEVYVYDDDYNQIKLDDKQMLFIDEFDNIYTSRKMKNEIKYGVMVFRDDDTMADYTTIMKRLNLKPIKSKGQKVYYNAAF